MPHFLGRHLGSEKLLHPSPKEFNIVRLGAVGVIEELLHPKPPHLLTHTEGPVNKGIVLKEDDFHSVTLAFPSQLNEETADFGGFEVVTVL